MFASGYLSFKYHHLSGSETLPITDNFLYLQDSNPRPFVHKRNNGYRTISTKFISVQGKKKLLISREFHVQYVPGDIHLTKGVPVGNSETLDKPQNFHFRQSQPWRCDCSSRSRINMRHRSIHLATFLGKTGNKTMWFRFTRRKQLEGFTCCIIIAIY